MGAFEYTALDARGRRKKGVLEGDAARAIRAQLRERGLTPIEVNEIAERATGAAGRSLLSFSRGMSVTELALFTRQLATLAHAGLPMEEALKAVAEQTENERVQKIIVGVRSQVVEGNTFAAALADFPKSFSPLYQATAAAGEQSGHIDEVLNGLADYVEEQQALRQKILAALIYPAFLRGRVDRDRDRAAVHCRAQAGACIQQRARQPARTDGGADRHQRFPAHLGLAAGDSAGGCDRGVHLRRCAGRHSSAASMPSCCVSR